MHKRIITKYLSIHLIKFLSWFCFKKFIPDEGINVVLGFLHTHLAGHSLKTKLIRNNEVVGYVFNDPAYDFNYQSQIDIQPIKIKKVS